MWVGKISLEEVLLVEWPWVALTQNSVLELMEREYQSWLAPFSICSVDSTSETLHMGFSCWNRLKMLAVL